MSRFINLISNSDYAIRDLQYFVQNSVKVIDTQNNIYKQKKGIIYETFV